MSQDSGPQTPADPVDTEKIHPFNGTGTAEDPFIVEFQKDDQSNPMNWGRLENGLIGVILVPETYGPVLLDRKAIALSKADEKVYISVLEKNMGKKQPSEVFGRALVRPWILLFREYIVLIASLYMAIIYGTIYMFLGAIPIVYNELRKRSPGFGGLAFLGMAVGIITGLGLPSMITMAIL
ncbi:Major facilitator superfamily domain, general substrate transporter, partial [Metarhizium brunneum ARSEF 3297]